MSATDGMGRRNPIVEAVARRSTSTLPITTPTVTPATVAMLRPMAQPRMVSSSAVQNAPDESRAPSARAISLNGGR
ncbi:MAG: hypothetical protein ABIR39_19690 [Nocardioides sp.]|uniref:hypothetical protein n=1 Tax=Nocardioides sp. TaxID=35761 RepID=UPI0032638BF6